ncbi:Dihydropteroate synthase [Trametopsis cervina]|nr:Dihydropteroate synthase [Trametopsis cervina]
MSYDDFKQNRTPAPDVIRVKNIFLTPSFTDGAQWATAQKAKPQPAYVTVSVEHSVAEAAITDNLELSINYSTVCKTIVEASKARAFQSSEDFLHYALATCFDEHQQINAMSMQLVRPKALLQPACTKVVAYCARGTSTRIEAYSISGLECYPIVGVNNVERVQEQLVRFDVTWNFKSEEPTEVPLFPIRQLSEQLTSVLTKTTFLTLEALVSLAAKTVLRFDPCVSSVTVCGGKPNALSLAEAPEVEITRTAADFGDLEHTALGLTVSGLTHHATLALGSNLGDRVAHIEYALRLLETPSNDYAVDGVQPYVSIVDTSFLYETEPMYVTDQPPFMNCACAIETNIPPVPLLKLLKEIESRVGRVKSFRNGPRTVDLDIVTYDNLIFDTRTADARNTLDNLEGHLVIPHPRMSEREFVLRPLNDIIPDYLHPVSRRPVHSLLASVLASQPADVPAMNRIIPFPQYPVDYAEEGDSNTPRTAGYWEYPSTSSPSTSQRTYIMATLNATPDSFSDGSVNNSISAGSIYATKAVESGADIIDIGGYSTRPGATFVPVEEETTRVVSMIKAIRAKINPEPRGTESPPLRPASGPLISVDTFRWEVAEAAVRAGANCINDVYAFTGPEYPQTQESTEHLLKMRKLARELAVPVILMHSRGDASANKDYSQYAYAADARERGAVVEAVRVELGEKVDKIVKGKGGLRRWKVIVDPGVGFSKTLDGNLEVLRDSASIVRPQGPGSAMNALAGFPILIGASRKSFLGAILSTPDDGYAGRETKPVERGWATAAAVACAVQQRVNIVRVHDVLEMGDVVRVASQLRV